MVSLFVFQHVLKARGAITALRNAPALRMLSVIQRMENVHVNLATAERAAGKVIIVIVIVCVNVIVIISVSVSFVSVSLLGSLLVLVTLSLSLAQCLCDCRC